VERAGSPDHLIEAVAGRVAEITSARDGRSTAVITPADDGTHLFEVLEAEKPTYSDLRAAATWTAEIRFALGRPVDQVILVCAAEPAEQWAAETVEGVFGASVVWWESEAWRGASAGAGGAVPVLPGLS
jgi:hypothetical protein